MSVGPRLLRRVAAAAGVVALGAILIYAIGNLGDTAVRIEDFTLQEGPPATENPVVDQAAAARTAIDALTNLNESVKGLVLVEAHLARDLTEIRDGAGSLTYSSTDAADCWVFVYAAPPQNGFRTVTGLVVVDAQTGTVSATQLLQSN